MVLASDRLNATFSALADPTRRAILARRAGGECTVGELAEPLDMSLPAVSKHMVAGLDVYLKQLQTEEKGRARRRR